MFQFHAEATERKAPIMPPQKPRQKLILPAKLLKMQCKPRILNPSITEIASSKCPVHHKRVINKTDEPDEVFLD